MKCVITDQLVLSRAPEGPLSGYVGPFADFLSAQGYALKSIHRQVDFATWFSLWAHSKRYGDPTHNPPHLKHSLSAAAPLISHYPQDFDGCYSIIVFSIP